MPKLIEFNTERLHLRQWCADDREPFAQLNADPRVMEFFPNLLDQAASDALLDRIETKIRDQGWGWWAVEITATREFIGFVGLNIPAPDLPCSPCVEVGWRLAFPYWGKGYATEAAREALRIGFEVLQFEEIVSFTAIPNRRSQAVMERLNMRKMPETFLHPRISIGHPLAEHCLYKLSRSDFKRYTDSSY
ncbi:MAG: GNAT family N-acetyltransferase [Stenomitos rutilans HA7619-LM2]|jgi:RimJ/RimL family protein N-acetyltransferase|nr:GNAT family N-acetyltransferase [Stenomitos rutilans HA7619-LM2]